MISLAEDDESFFHRPTQVKISFSLSGGKVSESDNNRVFNDFPKCQVLLTRLINVQMN